MKPRLWTFDLKDKHPRLYDFLYQLVLYGVTFQCAIAMIRYLPYSLPSDIDSPVGNATNSTTERMCKWGAREDQDFGSIACPSTFTVIISTIIFFVGIIRLQYLNRADILQTFLMFNGAYIQTFVRMDWHHIFKSIQIILPINIWVASWTSALIHPLWRWAFPGSYARTAATVRLQMDEWAKKWEEGKRKAEGRDVESGIVGEGREVVGLEGVDEHTPLTGRGFERMRAASVELPHTGDVES